ncbi:uncharacterized protein LOC143808926 [Ranitomeya variabilis]|uniref:uncharacterized protein LOC143808926 n=1 Tax=Ranitomeya variabilis TaxID=490064 RepID=UPI004055D5CB
MPSEAPVENTQIPGSSSQMPVGEEGGRRPTRRTRPPERLSMELPVRGQQRRARSPSREQGPGGSRRRRPMAVSTPRQPGTRSGLQGQSHQQDTQGRARQANRTSDRRAISQYSHGSQEETGDEHAEDGRWSQGTRGPSFRDADSGGEEDSRSTAAGGRMTPARPGQVPIVIWILGHSYVYWGAQRADRRTGGRQLGMARNGAVIRWLGYRGLTWGRVLHEFFRAVNLYGVPDILVLHAGGNDLGAISGKGLSAKIRTDIRQLGLAFPNLRLVWSDMVPRKNWRGARSVKKINKARITVNKEVSKFVSRNGGVTIRHAGLDSTEGDYWLGDGVHLNTAGTDLWIEGLLGGMRKAAAGLVGGVSSN